MYGLSSKIFSNKWIDPVTNLCLLIMGNSSSSPSGFLSEPITQQTLKRGSNSLVDVGVAEM